MISGKLKILFEDDSLLALDKPSGLIVNRSQTANDNTLQDLLADYFKLEKGNLGIGDRAGIVHRLDKETSGVLLVAKTQAAFGSLQKQFFQRSIKKTYIALTHARFGTYSQRLISKIRRSSKSGFKFIQDDLGREAVTDLEVFKQFEFDNFQFEKLIGKFKRSKQKYLINNARLYSLVKLYPQTGRTHQIRVHLSSIKHPIVSDPIYGPFKIIDFDYLWCPRLFLHAAEISFTHPRSKKNIRLESKLPKDLKNALQCLYEV